MWQLLVALRPKEGWFVSTLLISATLSVAFSVHRAGWVDGSVFLLPLALVALLLGRWIGASGLSPSLSWVLSVTVGMGWVFAAVGSLVPPATLLAGDLGRLGAWLADVVARRSLEQAPFVASGYYVMQQLSGLTADLGRWVEAGLSGGRHGGRGMFLLLVALGLWFISFCAGWEMLRNHRAMLAITPLGLAMGLNSAYAFRPDLTLVFLASVVLLLVQGHFLALVARWERRGTDYSPEIRLDMALHSVWITIVVLAAAWIFPFVASRRTAELLWRPFVRPWRWASARVAPLFSEVRTPSAGGRGTSASFGDLPLSHVLGGPPDLRNVVVMTVSTSDPPPIVEPEFVDYDQSRRHEPYWRGVTYDRYIGRGWENTIARDRRVRSGRPLAETSVEGQGQSVYLEQHYQLLSPTGQVRYVVNHPLFLDETAVIRERGDDDVAAILSSATVYSVVSEMPRPSETQLREAVSDYPPHIQERYLQLPDVPLRVMELAEEVVADAETPYDKARALEAYLRTMPYDLEVPLPPQDQDVVDYFLFDLRRGYCDYFATAMVVMARSVGVPARLATGYATGTYDPTAGYYVVVGLNAHAWPEVYFPGYGWIEFEPTPAYGVFPWPESLPEVPQGLGAEPAEQARRGLVSGPVRGVGTLGLAVAVVLGLAFLAWLTQPLWARSRTSAEQVQAVYDRLCGAAARLGWGPRIGETPLEYTAALGQALGRRVLALRLLSRPYFWRAVEATADTARIGQAYVKAQYSRQPVTDAERRQVSAAWRRLRTRLLLLFVGSDVSSADSEVGQDAILSHHGRK